MKSKLNVALLVAFAAILMITGFFLVKVSSQKKISQSTQNNLASVTQQTAPSSNTTKADVSDTVKENNAQAVPDKNLTQFEKTKKKLTQDINILELSAFKTRNSLAYVALDKDSLNLYGVDIDSNDKLSTPIIFDSQNITGNRKGFWNLCTGNTYEYLLYFSDEKDKFDLVFDDLSTLNKRNIYSFSKNEQPSRALFSNGDSEVIYTRFNAQENSIDILSNSPDFSTEKTIGQIKPAAGSAKNPITWMDLSIDDKFLLYCLRDNETHNPVLWVYDLANQKSVKFTNSTQHVLSASWSKDSNRIVYSLQEEKESSNIFVYDFETKSHIRITDGHNKNKFPNWSYHGEKILYLSEENGVSNLYVINYSN